MPDIRYGKTHGYNVLDLRNNNIKTLNGFNVYKYNSVDLRGNPITSCIGLPLDIVRTDGCGDEMAETVEKDSGNNKDDYNGRDIDTGSLVKTKPSVTKRPDDSGLGIHGVEQVDNRSGKMVIVVVSASGGGIGLLITIIITTVIHLYRKGLLNICCQNIINKVKRNRPIPIDIESDISSLGPNSDWMPMPSTSASTSNNRDEDNTIPKTIINDRYNPNRERQIAIDTIDSCKVDYKIYGEDPSTRKEEAMEIDSEPW